MGGLGLVFGGAMAAVLTAGIVLSQLVADPDRTEGPCAPDFIKFATVVLVVLIGVLWLIAAIAYEADRHRESDSDGDR
jgi:uncharacterized membrane protein YidH (DUF202 family)